MTEPEPVCSHCHGHQSHYDPEPFVYDGSDWWHSRCLKLAVTKCPHLHFWVPWTDRTSNNGLPMRDRHCVRCGRHETRRRLDA